MAQTKKYQRCMVMAGGGFRFGIYLGMHAAACDAGYPPDILLASCGGSLAANIICALPDAAQRKAWLSSPDMYRFWCYLKSAPQTSIVRTLARAAQRKLSRQNAPKIPDSFNDYLFDVPLQLPLPPMQSARQEIAVAIIGARLLFSEDEIGQVRKERKLFAETVFCNLRSSVLLQDMMSPFNDPRWGQHAISRDVILDSTTPPDVAARISIADMFYFRCYRHGPHHYIGGVIDLFPIEIAKRLADQVIMEFKSAFDQHFSIPAWRSVLGLDGNARLRYANGQFVDSRIDTSDISFALSRETTEKKLDWRNNRIKLVMPDTHETYADYMEAQWQYGYQRGLEAFERTATGVDSAMRKVDRYNRGCQ